MEQSVMIGMSGGVDSAVAAALLLRAGYRVCGVTFQLWENSESSAYDAAQVAALLGIPHRTVDWTALFRKEVADYFAAEYQRGRTPNPCVMCNRKIKFARFLEYATECGYDKIATGHYARISESGGAFHLSASKAGGKDQSYFLYTLTQSQLSRTLLPLADLDKEGVRALAEELSLPIAKKADSQDICFIPDGDYLRFLKEYAGYTPQKGYFRSQSGEILGEHDGIAGFTIGQRKGLGCSFGKPMFVTALDAETNTVVLGEAGTEFLQEFTASDLSLIEEDALRIPRRVQCKIRYAARPADCLVSRTEEKRVLIQADSPVRAVTPGQAVVFYDGERVLGGATIDSP